MLTKDPDKRPNFNKIEQDINLVEIDEDNWNTSKPLWRKMPLDYNYSHPEEEDFISETSILKLYHCYI